MRRRRASEQEEGGGVVGGPRASGMATSSSIEGQSGPRGHPGPDSEISESEEEDELAVLGEEEELVEEKLLKMSKMMRFENEFKKKMNRSMIIFPVFKVIHGWQLPFLLGVDGLLLGELEEDGLGLEEDAWQGGGGGGGGADQQRQSRDRQVFALATLFWMWFLGSHVFDTYVSTLYLYRGIFDLDHLYRAICQ